MALARVKRFVEEVPTAADFNAEFDNICAKFDSNITSGDLDPTALPSYEPAISADNYANLIDAVAAAVSAGKSLWLSSTTYTLDTPLTIPSNLKLQGSGVGNTVITGAGGYAYTALIQLGSNDAAHNIVLAGLTIREPSSYASTINTFAGIKILGAGDIASNAVLLEDIAFDFDTSTDAGRSKYCVEISAGSGVCINRCEFDMDEISGRSSSGIGISKGYGIDIGYCTFNGGNYSVRGIIEAPVQTVASARIHDNVFVGTLGTFVYAASIGGVIKNNLFYSVSPCTQNQLIFINGRISSSLVITDNVFNCEDSAKPAYVIMIYDREFVVVERNVVEGAGYPYGFLRSDEDSIQYNWWANNQYPGTSYGYSGTRVNSLFGKKFDSPLPFMLEDVYIWIRWNTTNTRNELCFSLTRPTTNSDYDAYVALTGTTNLVP